MPNYWVVGAMLGGEDDQFDKFINGGYWHLGYKADEQPIQAKRRGQISEGDRIAIKRMLGTASPDIQIRAIGIVRAAADANNDVKVDWIHRDVNRPVPARGCFASIHGPFDENDDWTKKVFGDLVAQLDTVEDQTTYQS